MIVEIPCTVLNIGLADWLMMPRFGGRARPATEVAPDSAKSAFADSPRGSMAMAGFSSLGGAPAGHRRYPATQKDGWLGASEEAAINSMNGQQAEREVHRAQVNRGELVVRIARAIREDGSVEPLRGPRFHRSSSKRLKDARFVGAFNCEGSPCGPSALVLGHTVNGRALHAVCAIDPLGDLVIMTTYEPTLPRWTDERTRNARRGSSW